MICELVFQLCSQNLQLNLNVKGSLEARTQPMGMAGSKYLYIYLVLRFERGFENNRSRTEQKHQSVTNTAPAQGSGEMVHSGRDRSDSASCCVKSGDRWPRGLCVFCSISPSRAELLPAAAPLPSNQRANTERSYRQGSNQYGLIWFTLEQAADPSTSAYMCSACSFVI